MGAAIQGFPKKHSTMSNNKLDIIVWGATGFTGALVAEYLAEKPATFTFGLAGRNLEKLEAVKDSLTTLNSQHKNITLIVADSNDAKSLDSMVKRCKVIISTVGPYDKYGIPLVEVCVRNQVHYVDLTGEPLFIKHLVDNFHAEAVKNQVAIVPSTGFDSMPFDLCVYLIAEELAKTGLKVGEVRTHLRAAKGGVSGGTLASMAHMLSLPTKDLKVVGDPYCLADSSLQVTKRDSFSSPVFHFDKRDTKRWESYFIMENTNTRYVRRTCSLLKYGPGFSYYEAWTHSSFFKALLHAVGILTLIVLVWIRPIRWLLQKALPPGSGPSLEARKSGYMWVEVYGVSEDGSKKIKATARMNMDPGYGGTARMIAEAALTLVDRTNNVPATTPVKIPTLKGGILTCASGLGMRLVDRLRSSGTMELIVEQVE